MSETGIRTIRAITDMPTIRGEDCYAKGIVGGSFFLEDYRPAAIQVIKELGLDKMALSVFIKDRELSGLDDLGILRTMPCRWWLHGWAQSGSVTDEVATAERGLSKVQNWLKANPDKAFLAPDSLGFGSSEFSWDTLKHNQYKCGPSYYARGIELERESLGIPKKNCFMDGFSTGGAAAYCLIPYDYKAEQLRVIAPAIFVKEGAQRINKLRELQRKEFQMDQQSWFGKSARWKYLRLYQLLSLAAAVEPIGIGSPIAAWAYEKILSDSLMGVDYAGEINEGFRPVLMRELKTHSKVQIVPTKKRLLTAAAVMGQLYQGISINKWLDDWLVEAAKVKVEAAEKDSLVLRQDIADWQTNLLLTMRERNSRIFQEGIKIVQDRLGEYSQNKGFKINVGHSALDVLAG